jgi:hypothetical protein
MENTAQQNLRSRIQEIQRDESLTPQQKSRSIQQLMMGNFQSSQGGEQKEKEEEKKIELDTSVTYHNKEAEIFGCSHYMKNCKIKAACCGQLFTCRRCHDEQVNDHKINRYLIEDMMCFFCSTVQPISNECTNCHKQMAHYFCRICKFFDGNEAKHIWHCDKCGLCRVGQKDAHAHCDECHTCMPINHKDHVNQVLDCNCPICGENMFHSTQASLFPEPCHHAIHSKCFKQYLRSGKYSCPICSKTYAELDMSAYWAELDQAIIASPIPEEYKDWKVEFLCNDCNIKEICNFHFFGHKCSKCKGYNTNIITTMRPGDEQGIVNENQHQQNLQQQNVQNHNANVIEFVLDNVQNANNNENVVVGNNNTQEANTNIQVENGGQNSNVTENIDVD